MKKRLVKWNEQFSRHVLIGRARFSPPKRRRPVEASICYLRDDEFGFCNGKPVFTQSGRFEAFRKFRLAHRALLGDRLTIDRADEMIAWINERGLAWNLEIIGEHSQTVRSQFVLRPEFSFTRAVEAVEFKLIFG